MQSLDARISGALSGRNALERLTSEPSCLRMFFRHTAFSRYHDGVEERPRDHRGGKVLKFERPAAQSAQLSIIHLHHYTPVRLSRGSFQFGLASAARVGVPGRREAAGWFCQGCFQGADLNFTPIRSACRHTTMQCRMALSKSRSNFGGSAVASGSHIPAPVDEKFRTVQSVMEALLPKMILPDLRTLCRGEILRSPRS
jgi:hypothetical protein